MAWMSVFVNDIGALPHTFGEQMSLYKNLQMASLLLHRIAQMRSLFCLFVVLSLRVVSPSFVYTTSEKGSNTQKGRSCMSPEECMMITSLCSITSTPR